MKPVYKFLLLVITLGFLLRFLTISSNPPALSGDELTLTYDTYSVLKTHHSQTGDYLPLTLKMGEDRPAGYLYFSLPFVAIFGPTEMGIRLLSVLSGTAMIYLIFLLSKNFFSEKAALFSSLIIAISPWGINLARNNIDINFSLFLTLSGVVLFLESKKRIFLLPLSALCFILSTLTYQTAKLTAPLLILALVIYQGKKFFLKEKTRKWLFLSTLLLAIGGAILIQQGLTSGAQDRFFRLNIFTNQEIKTQIINKIDLERSISLFKPISPLFHNKFVEYGAVVARTTFLFFSGDYLFVYGDANPRHNMGETGQVYFIEALFIVIGIYLAFKKHRNVLFLLLFILFAGALPAILLGELHAPRSALMLIPLVLLSSLGLEFLFTGKYKLKNLAILIALLFLIGQFSIYTERVFFISGSKFSRFWSYPAKLAAVTTLNQMSHYKSIFLSGKIDNIEEAYRVYGKIDPSTVLHSGNQVKTSNIEFSQYGNVYIGDIPQTELIDFTDKLEKPSLIIISKEEYLSLKDFSQKDNKYLLILQRFKTVKGLDQDIAFAEMEKR